MDSSIFSTQVTQGNGKQTALGGASTGVTAGVGGSIDFWQVLFGNLLNPEAGTNNNQNLSSEEIQEKIKEKISESSLDGSKQNFGDIIKGDKIDISLLKSILASVETPEGQISEEATDLKIERLVDILGTFTNGIPQEELHNYDTKKSEGEDALSLVLLTTNLNPAELSKITERIEKVEAKLGRPLTIDDIISGVGNIIPVQGDDDHEFSKSDFLGVLLKPVENEEQVITGQIKSLIKDEKTNAEDTSNDFIQELGLDLADGNDISIDKIVQLIQQGLPPEEIAQQLNNISVGEKQTENQNLVNFPLNNIAHSNIANTGPSLSTQASGSVKQAQWNAGSQVVTGESLPEEALIEGENFIGNLKNVNIKSDVIQGQVKNISMATTAPLPQVPPIPLANIAFANIESDFFTQGFFGEDGFEYNLQTGAPFSSTMQAAHMTSMTAQAGQSHAATNMIAAHMTKAARNGETQLTLQLDPPELGRVEVRLEFGHDKSVKANLIIEKPETYLMLQRDNAALEKALQNAGLETDSGALNYEMASENYFSDDRQNGNGSNSQTADGSGSDTDENIEIIESTMTWHVDPETGHMRYNILA